MIHRDLQHIYTFLTYAFLLLRIRFSTGGAQRMRKKGENGFRVQSLMYISTSRLGDSPSSRPSIHELDCPPFNPFSELLGINKSKDLQSGENKTKQSSIEAKRFRSQIATYDCRQPFPLPRLRITTRFGCVQFFHIVHIHYLSGKLHG